MPDFGVPYGGMDGSMKRILRFVGGVHGKRIVFSEA